MRQEVSLHREYHPVAQYYEDADIVEYVRVDAPAVHRRIDGWLTLVLDMDTREPIGFALKGFRNFYVRHLQEACDRMDIGFVQMSRVLENAMSAAGNEVFDESRMQDYLRAYKIAKEDAVELRDVPRAA